MRKQVIFWKRILQKVLKLGTIIIANSKLGLYVKAKEGVLNILEVQGENAKRMEAKVFLVGNMLTERRKI